MVELKKCMRCGGNASVKGHVKLGEPKDTGFKVVCENSDAETYTYNTKEEAINHWNNKNYKGVAKTILIFNELVGFYRIDEGAGTNLLEEDEEQGFVDYIMLNELEFDGYDSFVEIDGTQVMLTELYQEKFNTVQEILEYLIWETGFLPDANYVVLYAK